VISLAELKRGVLQTDVSGHVNAGSVISISDPWRATMMRMQLSNSYDAN